MTDNGQGPVSNYLQYLPAQVRSEDKEKFLGWFLLAFEKILSGLRPWHRSDDPNKEQQGLEEYIEGIYSYFDPEEAPADFLPWLATWVAASWEDEWEEKFKRDTIANSVELYKQRGTLAGLKKLLKLFTDEDAKIYELDWPPHYFQVEILLRKDEEAERRRLQEIARRIIDRAKPAHTFYALRVRVPALQIKNDAQTKADGGIWVGSAIIGSIIDEKD